MLDSDIFGVHPPRALEDKLRDERHSFQRAHDAGPVLRGPVHLHEHGVLGLDPARPIRHFQPDVKLVLREEAAVEEAFVENHVGIGVADKKVRGRISGGNGLKCR